MAKSKETSKDILTRIDLIKKEQELLTSQLRIHESLNNKVEARKIEEELILTNRRLLVDLEKLTLEFKKDGNNLSTQEKKIIDNIYSSHVKVNAEISKSQKLRRGLISILNETNSQLKSGWQFIMQSDKAIKSTIRSLGMSGSKADLMRSSFEQSAGYVARLGGNLGDIQAIMQGYADETGRARVLSSEMVQDITAIGKGTDLGIEGATKLAAQFELMGYDARSTMKYVQGVVDTSERMGVNTSKVLKNVSDNFKRLNTFNFQQGVKGFAQMAQYAEKMQIDMNQALNAAEIARSLEGAVNLAAQLQVMGGEFAKTDPFELLFLSRNDPAKFTEKINDMTKGVVTFRKMADGSFEKFISPADRDRLASVEKSLGMQSGELTKQAERMADIQKMRNDMRGMGLSDEQKKLIEGAAIMNKESGKFQVTLGGRMRDITTLTKEQANSFYKEQKSLEERAKEAQTFEEVFQSTIMELKSALLPLLNSVNGFLKTVRPVVEKITGFLTSGPLGWMKVIGAFTAATLLWKGANKIFSNAVNSFIERGVSGGAKSRITPRTPKGGGITRAAKGGGGALSGLGKGLGIGAAAAGTGAGIMFAAEGISKLADSMSKLTPEQSKALETIATTLAITFPLASIGIALVGQTAQAGALGLLALGAAVALVGGGIYLATTGIGNMANGLTGLVEAGKGAGDDMLKLSVGIGALSLAMLGFSAGAFGLLVFSGVMSSIAKHAGAISKVGEGFKQINAVMAGNKDDYIQVANAIERISNANISAGGMFSELATLLKTPLKVEFANKEVTLVNDVTLNLDGQKLMNKSYNVDVAIQKYEALRQGKGNNA